MHSDASVLIFTATWIDPLTGEDAIQPECERMIKAQVGVDFDWHVTTDNPYPIATEQGKPEHRNVLHQYRQAREYFLNGKWDVLLTVEHDCVLPDEEAVQRLLDTPGDVIYAPYMLRHGQRHISTFQYINDRNLGMSLSGYKRELKEARERKIHRVSGVGFGCTLIRRNVLEAVEFTGAQPRDANECPDLRFSEDCLRKRFVSYGRFDVPVIHIDGGVWLHPFANRRNNVMKYLAVETVRAFAAGRIVQLTKGGEIELTLEEAVELARVGYIDPGQIPVQLLHPMGVPLTPELGVPLEPEQRTAPVITAEETPIEPPAKRARRKAN